MTVTDVPTSTDRFFTDDTFDFEFRDALGATAYGVGDPGMWLATARQIVDGDQQSWFDAYDLYTAVQTYQLRDVAAQISTPLLITSPEDEQFWPGQSDQLAALLTAPHDVVPFTRQDGANFHCEPLARRLTSYRIFDWLTRHLDRRTPPDRSLPKHDQRQPDDEPRRGGPDRRRH